MNAIPASASLARTPLHDEHVALDARMVEFAGYAMPVSYPDGILAEHRHCRASAALFDVSHMGQLRIACRDDAARALESQTPADIAGLEVGKQRYALLTNANGGILDDMMVTRRDGDLLLVVNASRKAADATQLQTSIGHRCTLQTLADQSLLALQGPKAHAALARLNPGVGSLTFMTGGWFELEGARCYVTRSGYTGEDGFEISLPSEAAVALWRALLAQPEVRPAGLGARDTLRLEAGLPLYGHDIDATTTPVEAGLAWAIPKVRRSGGAREGGYPGSSVIERQFGTGVTHKRIGLVGLERMPVREGTTILDSHNGHKLGHVTSGTLGPTLDKPIAMAYLAANHTAASHEVDAEVRGKRYPMRVAALPFVPHRYHRV